MKQLFPLTLNVKISTYNTNFLQPKRNLCNNSFVNINEEVLCEKAISKEVENNKNIVLYKDLCTITNLEKGLARTKSNVSAGLDGEVKATYSNYKLLKLAADLKSHRYKASPTKRVWIPKPDGGKRPLGISTQRDKIVQAAILVLLEPILEKVFLECSFGFRPKLGCHNALHRVKRRWQNVTWIINVDISKYFDTIHHNKLISLLKPYCDQATIELVRKLIKNDLVDITNLANITERNRIGCPQGSLISPILANLYLHELDKFITDQILPRFNRGSTRKYVSGYQTRKSLLVEQVKAIESLEIEGAVDAIKALKHSQWVKNGFGSRDPEDQDFRRLYYVRYADDFLLGFSGTREEAVQIQNSIDTFLTEQLYLKVNDTKTSIHHSSDRNIKFLGFYIKYLPNKLVMDHKVTMEGNNVNQLKNVAINQAQLRIPVSDILQRYVEKGYVTIRKNGTFRATSCRKLSSFEDKLIVNRYSSIIRGLLNYYQPANQYSDMWPIVSILRKSCALTLADKHKLKTASKVYKKFGPNIKITNRLVPSNSTVLHYPTTLRTTGNFKLGKPWVTMDLVENDDIKGSYHSNPKTSTVCQYPGCKTSDNLEEHHINMLKNLVKKGLHPYLKSIIAKKRETVTLCNEHHNKLHSGNSKDARGPLPLIKK